VDAQAQGWYRDPYGVHQDRYFSAGSPTKLVRDDGRESYDPPPPDRPFPDDDLIPVPPIGSEASDGSDLQRVDQAAANQPTAASLRKQYRRALTDYFETLPKP
jgi:hypothetical protein